MNKLHRLLLAVASILMVSSIQAEQLMFPPEEEPTPGYLGITVDKVPPSIWTLYPDEVAAGIQGLVVTGLSDQSPAAYYGVKLYDILVAYDGHSIVDPDKFIDKVKGDLPGRVVRFELLRKGEHLTVPVTIGEQYTKQTVSPIAQVPQMQQQASPQDRQMQNSYAAKEKTQSDTNFDGLAIRKISGDIYDASIGFNAWDGTRQRRSYKGTREQILHQVLNAQDLPPEVRQQLLFAIKPRKQSSGWGGMPFGDGNMFDPGSFFKGWGF